MPSFSLTANVGSYSQLQIAGDLASPILDSCLADKAAQARLTCTEQKDAHRKPLLPRLSVADVMAA